MPEAAENTAPPARRRTSLSRRLLFAAVPCVLLLALLEIGCRLLGWGAPDVAPASSNESREVELTAPDGTRSVYRETVYVGRPVRTNARGFRDWLYATDNAEGALRVAAVGDSFTFGDGLTQSETWPRRLESKLAALALPRTVRSMNFGRRAANTVEEAATLEGHVLPFRPDLVVLGFTLFNDAETAVHRARTAKEFLAREETWHWKLVHWAHDRSWFVNALSDRVRRGRKRAELIAHVERQYADDAPGWVECRAALDRIAAACAERGVPLILLIFPAHHRDPALNDWSRYELRAVHDKLRAALSGHPEVVVVDLADHLADLSGKTIWVPGDGHPNAVYAERAAEALFEPAARALRLALR